MPLPRDVLDQLLKDGILTQGEYDAIEDLQQQSDAGPGGNKPGGNAPGGASAQDVTYAAATSLTSGTELEAGEYTSETADENAILIDTDESVTLNQPTVTKTGDSDGGDNCNFYGLNAAVLAMGGADVTISGGAITTDGDGANGVFSYGGNGGAERRGGRRHHGDHFRHDHHHHRRRRGRHHDHRRRRDHRQQPDHRNLRALVRGHPHRPGRRNRSP